MSIGHTQPRPDYDPGATQAVTEALIAHRAATAQLLDAHQALMDRLDALGLAVPFETVVLTPTATTFESREQFARPVRSIGLLNPNNIIVYFSGIGSAAAAMRSPSAPPNSLIVLPISAQQIEVAVNPADLGANTAICFLMRFPTIQPAYLGKGA